eukprot:TRINITY_DN7083_c0_g1_i1.p1 TRINITY_DN7083_c0_g1~~TRINITY_DN7083_c0_g1_i1.p1  ORF type:complete len:862 (+),score=221.30 TRINITY_DN7083_c0_g1_i1:213-2798(+)
MTTEERQLVWKKHMWMGCYTMYQRLVEYLSQDINFMCVFASTIEATEVDQFARVIVSIFNCAHRTTGLIRHMIFNEFSKVVADSEGSVMRGNNVINKIEGVYVKQIGAQYLKFVIGDLISKIATDTKLNLEIDSRKISLTDESDAMLGGLNSALGPKTLAYDSIVNVEEIVAQNRRKLQETAQAILDRITDESVIDQMPVEIRQIAATTAECAKAFAPEHMYPLIGGFIMLRFFSPAIAAPESSSLLPPEVIPCSRAKRNLVLLAKLCQNASNGVLFGAKEPFMTCMNDFITSNKSKMNDYFTAVSTFQDPEVNSTPKRQGKIQMGTSGRAAGSALAAMLKDSSLSSSGGGANGASTAGNGSSATATIKRPNFFTKDHKEIDLTSMDLQDLFDLHRVLDQSMDKINIKYRSISYKISSEWSNAADLRTKICDLLKELGPSPKTKNTRAKAKEAEEEVLPDQTPIIGSERAFEDIMQILEKARFLYQGPNNKQDQPVFYLIVNRIKAEFLDNVNPLVSYIFKVMDFAVQKPYSIVVDMSWASVNSDLKRAVYTHLPKLAKIFSRKYKKNVNNIFVVHPSAYTRAVVHFMRFFTSRKLKRKIVEIYNWKDLTKTIDVENILLPETSKDYITKSYRVIKVNAKGKKQERLIKFTPNSILNIDPKTKVMSNEKRIDEIEEIISAPGSPEFLMRFAITEGAVAKKKNPLVFSGAFSSAKDLYLRRYICNTIQERDSVLQDIYEMGFKGHWMKANPEFKVTKVNQAGKHQERVFKLTIDSLLNLNSNTIKSETSFAGIDTVTQDSYDPDIIYLKLKGEPFTRKLFCHGNGKALAGVLLQELHRYSHISKEQEGLEQNEGDLHDVYNE